jgi:hypothetical protein
MFLRQSDLHLMQDLNQIACVMIRRKFQWSHLTKFVSAVNVMVIEICEVAKNSFGKYFYSSVEVYRNTFVVFMPIGLVSAHAHPCGVLTCIVSPESSGSCISGLYLVFGKFTHGCALTLQTTMNILAVCHCLFSKRSC